MTSKKIVLIIQLNALLPLLIDDANDDSSKLLNSILMMQMMSDSKWCLTRYEFAMMFVLLSSMSGAASYESNFNLLLL